MIVSKIIQKGLKMIPENKCIPFQYSSNIKMCFIKDENYEEYVLNGYYIAPGSVEAKLLEIDQDGIFILKGECFANKGTLSLSFSLIKDNEEIHLGVIEYDVHHAFGSGEEILPEDDQTWIEIVSAVAKDSIASEIGQFETKVAEANSNIDEKIKEAENQANKAKNEADRAEAATDGKVDKMQGVENAKKVLKTDTDGNVITAIDFDIERYFAMQKTGKIYTVRFPLFSVSQSPLGEKMDDNAELTCEPSTDKIKAQDDYQSIPLFKTYDVNAICVDGKINVTAFKGDSNFKDTGEVDVFVLGMAYYEKYWKDENYWYYSRTDMPREGYTLARECINADGTEAPYALYGKYVVGEIDGKPYSSKKLMPKRNISHNNAISYFRKKGNDYAAGSLATYKYLMTTFYLKYATLNTQSKMCGCFNYYYQYVVSDTEIGVKRVILTNGQANNLVVGSCISIGDKGDNTSSDRSNAYMHNIAENVEITEIVQKDDTYSYVYVDTENEFDTTPTTYISTMHWRSGFSDKVLGRDGSPGNLTSGKYPMVLQGIECAVGGYEVAGNAFMDIINDQGHREVYVVHDNSEITSNITDAKAKYQKSDKIIKANNLSAWNYITGMELDVENGYFGITEAGTSGSGSAAGFCDGLYVDSAASGQREFLLLGALRNGSIGGLSYLYAGVSLASAYWNYLARLSISGVAG